MKLLLPIFTSLALLPCIMANAQKTNPFKSINKKAKVHTLSDGKYAETYDDEVLQRVGTVIIDRRTQKIVKLLDADSIGNEVSDNSTVSRWYGIDPLAEKYYSISPYAFVANNPIGNIDTDGRDIVVLNNPNGASGYGHMAAIIGSDKSGWTFISKEGRQKTQWYSNELTGGPALPPKIMTFATLKDFKDAQGKDKDLGNYSQNARFATDEKQDASAASATEDAAKSWYNVITANCGDAVSDGLQAVGLDPGNVTESGGLYPVTTTPAKPNDRFQAIIKNNSDKVIPTYPTTPTTTNTNLNDKKDNTQH